MEIKEQIQRELKKMTKRRKTNEGLVSVILPIYGVFDVNRLILATESARTQKGVNVEVIVSEQGPFPRLERKLHPSIRYAFTFHQPREDLSDFNPGSIRNLAADLARGEFLYTTDADVILTNPNYLFSLLDLMDQDRQLVLYRPPMRRLVEENFGEFLNRVNSTGLSEAIDSLDVSQPFIATTDGKRKELKVVTRQRKEYEKTFTTSIENFQRYLADLSLRGKEPVIWTEDRHCGANFMRREQFDLVGRYCERFINWGCEDSDLQWKLSQVFNLQLIPKEKKYEVLHLDHSRGYFSPEMWRRNEEICEGRKKIGVRESIKEDIEK